MDILQNKDFSAFTITAVEAALKAGEILKKGFGSKYKISNKEGIHNLVTEYDLASEKIIIDFIKKRFPDHSILAEEEGEIDSSKNEYQWVIDPLDGTVNFAHDIAMFAVTLGIRDKNTTLSGVVYQPVLNEIFIAEKNKGAYLNGSKLSVTNTKNLKASMLSTGFAYDFYKNPNRCIDRFNNILQLGIPIRRMGAAAIDLAYVAAGRFDAFWETGLGPWDCIAGNLLIEEAGGKITTLDGDNFKLQEKNALLASNTILHDQILKELNK